MNKKLLFMGGALFMGMLMANPVSAAPGRGGGHYHGGRGGGSMHMGRASLGGVRMAPRAVAARGWHSGARLAHRHYRAPMSYYRPYRTIVADPWAAAASPAYGARYAAIMSGYPGYAGYPTACGRSYYPMYSYPYYNTFACTRPMTCTVY